MTSSRTVEDVWNLVGHAKLDADELKTTAQTIKFASDLQTHQIKLMELPPELVNHIKTNNQLVIRGEASDSAVVCTGDKSWEIKEAELSNTMVILPELSHADQLPSTGERKVQCREAIGQFNTYFELRPWKPKPSRLRTLLSGSPYKGREFEVDSENQQKYTTEELLDVFQGSRKELLETLSSIFACEIQGHWRMLDKDYELRMLGFMLGVVEENSWPLTKVKKEEVIGALTDLAPQEVLEALFHWYMMGTEDRDENDRPFYAVNVDAVCRVHAEVLLEAAGRFSLSDFLSVWQDSVPLDLPVALSQLRGLALKDSSAIWIFRASDLPENVQERFDVLFRTKEKWTFEEIEAYVEDLATQKLNVNALLTKYSRCSKMQGIKYFSAKHGK